MEILLRGILARDTGKNSFHRVEGGETIGIDKRKRGERAVMVPADDELLRIYTEQNNEGS